MAGPRKGRRKEAERALKKLGTKEAGQLQPSDAFSASQLVSPDIFAGANRARGYRERTDRIAHRGRYPIQKARAPERDVSSVRPSSIHFENKFQVLPGLRKNDFEHV